jgi:aminopeptidase-like protein
MSLTNDFEKIDLQKAGNLMYKLAERLYPICRSITGNGVRETLSIINEFVPLNIREIPSGTKVFDWEIPDEWNIHDAWVKNPEGEKIVDFKKLNLHVLNYSIPVEKHVNLKELKEHLFTLPEYPEWVPYRTSYYTRQWGFCMAHNQCENLKDGNYQVKIDSEIKPGSLTYGECFIPGETNEEVLFSCHVCHPSLCNDNLSGIILATFLASVLNKMDLHFSYRFLFIPGTIGSIAWLSLNEDKIKNIKHGIVLTLLGDSSPFQFKRSRQGDAEIDKIMEYLLKDIVGSKMLEFSPYGYDERQFCSPGINLPVGRLSRTPFSEFPEYHTSADNLDFINADNLKASLSLLIKTVTIIEGNRRWINLNPKCEPQLGKRGLYNSVGGHLQHKDYQMALLWILNLSDGNHSLLDIAIKSKVDFELLLQTVNELLQANLINEDL